MGAGTITSVATEAIALADLALVDRFTGGEDAAAREIFRRHQRRVHATLYRILGPSRDAEDLVQETFIQVFRSIASFRGDARLSTWIDRIAARVAYRYLRASKRQLSLVDTDQESASQSASPRDQVRARLGIARLYAAMASLPPAARIAFAIHELDGRSVEEVAAILGASKTATKLRIWRARRALLRMAQGDALLREFLADTDLAEEEL